jgi:hypothetical protein
MEYTEVFIPVARHLQTLTPPLLPQQVGGSIKFGVAGFDWEWLRDFKIALVGLRRSGLPHCFSSLREALYSLYSPPQKIDMIDLGDIEIMSDMSVEANAEKVANTLHQILRQGVFPLVFAEDMRYSYWVYSSLKTQYRCISASYILPSANLGDPHAPLSEQNMVGHTFADLTRELSHLSIIGYQNYLTDPHDLVLLDKNYCETLRLGAIRDDVLCAEPLLRDATLLCASVNALRQSDAPAATQPLPNGLYTEEMCRLLRYAAFSNELKSGFVGGFNFANENRAQTANLVGQLLWHIIEGIANRVKEHPLDTKRNFRTVQIEMGKENQQIVFYQGKKTQRWWMEVPTVDGKQKCVIACKSTDYEQARNGTVPVRWLWFYKKISSA